MVIVKVSVFLSVDEAGGTFMGGDKSCMVHDDTSRSNRDEDPLGNAEMTPSKSNSYRRFLSGISQLSYVGSLKSFVVYGKRFGDLTRNGKSKFIGNNKIYHRNSHGRACICMYLLLIVKTVTLLYFPMMMIFIYHIYMLIYILVYLL